MNFTLEHLGLAARDPLLLKDWYVEVLGAEVVFDNQQPSRAFFLTLPGGPLIEIYQADLSLDETGINALAGWRHVALRVESIEASRSLLEKRGVKFLDPVKPAGGGGRILFFRDAEQNLLHLVERPPGSSFNAAR
jgi:catechol 2,3-dioxygenase-like lactoylglutathione lyase family enzyme